MRPLRRLSRSLLWFSVLLAAPATAVTWEPDASQQQQIRQWMDQLSVPGASVAVLNDGKVTWSRQFGLADVESKAPVTAETLFQAASMSKPVFAYLVLKLCEQGLFDLDRPLVEYYVPDYIVGTDLVAQITARHVLSHTTGLPNWAGGSDERLAPAFASGTAFRYSGEGYVWLQTAVERQTGQSLEQLARRLLFEPAGMSRTSFVWSEYEQEAAAYGYLAPRDGEEVERGFQFRREFFGPMLGIADDWGKPLAYWSQADERRAHAIIKASPETAPAIANAEIERYRLRQNRLQNAAGGLITTTEDYARFLALFMRETPVERWMLSAAMRDAMLARQTVTNNGYTNQTLGWRTESGRQGQLMFHGGNNGDQFRSFALANLSIGDGIVIMTNGGNGDRLARAIVENILDLRVADLNSAEPIEAPAEARPVYPRESWEYWLDPEAAGFDGNAIGALQQRIVDETAITGAMVVVGGKALFSVGDVSELSYVASVRKSLLGILFGRYVDAGIVDLQANLASLGIDDLQTLSKRERSATLEDLLTSRSGVYHDASNDGDDQEHKSERGSVEPGTRFVYNNWDFNAAGAIFEQLTGQNVYDALEYELARPIGMQDFDRSQQVKSGDASRSRYPAYHMTLSTRDLARVGYLMLRGGRWNDVQVVPESWVASSTSLITPAADLPDDSNRPLGFGRMWWVWDTQDEQSAFAGAFLARGYHGQLISVLPALDAVVAIKTNDAYERTTSGGDIYQILQALAAAHD